MDFRPDLIILDILLAGDNSGWAVLKSLKEDPQTAAVPVIIASMLDEPMAEMARGMAAYLVKPVTRTQLAQAIERIWSDPDDKVTTLPRPASPQVPRSRTSPLILLAEDNETNIITVMDFLIAKGFRVIVARDGTEAIARAEAAKPALILMDIQMPTMDGLTAITHLHLDQSLSHIPIIALTALAMPGDQERCLTAGANEYMTKPIQLTQLLKLIERHLAQPSAGNDVPAS
jgi:CheY-like chemotaxis protein